MTIAAALADAGTFLEGPIAPYLLTVLGFVFGGVVLRAIIKYSKKARV